MNYEHFAKAAFSKAPPTPTPEEPRYVAGVTEAGMRCLVRELVDAEPKFGALSALVNSVDIPEKTARALIEAYKADKAPRDALSRATKAMPGLNKTVTETITVVVTE
jgi:hypothetical protein